MRKGAPRPLEIESPSLRRRARPSPALRQDVQTFRRFGVPRTTARTRWMLGFHRRLVRTCECETLLPKLGCLPQTSQTEAMIFSSIR